MKTHIEGSRTRRMKKSYDWYVIQLQKRFSRLYHMNWKAVELPVGFNWHMMWQDGVSPAEAVDSFIGTRELCGEKFDLRKEE